MRYAKEWWNHLLPKSFVMYTKPILKIVGSPRFYSPRPKLSNRVQVRLTYNQNKIVD